MKQKITALLILLMTIVPSALAETEQKAQGDLKVLLPYAIKISIWVIVSSIVIAIGLWIYKQILDRKQSKLTDSKADKFTCEIDDTKTIDEAIHTFLVINK